MDPWLGISHIIGWWPTGSHFWPLILRPLVSRARTIPIMRASYFIWLLLEVNSNFSVCSISIFPGPSNIIPMLFPFTLDASSTYNTHSGGISSPIDELNSATKFSRACDLMLPLRMKWMSYFESSISQDTIFHLNQVSSKLDKQDNLFLPRSCDLESLVITCMPTQ